MRGAPKLLSSTTLRPLGPSVTFTASARISTPRRMRSRASRENFTSFAAMVPYLYFLIGNCVIGWNSPLLPSPRASVDEDEDVAIFHDAQVLAIDLHFGSRQLAEHNAVARLPVQRGHRHTFAALARAYAAPLAPLRLFPRG